MKRLTFLICVMLVFTTWFTALTPVTKVNAETSGTTIINTKLQDAMEDTSDPLEVIVTFHTNDGPTKEHAQLLKKVGITKGVTFNELPMAGVLATPKQIESLTQLEEIRSLYLNEELEYENEDSTDLTGVDKLREDAALTAKNDGLPVSGKGVGVVINDSGVDGTHKDIKFGDHLVQNVQGATNLNAFSDLLPITYVEDVPNTDSDSGHGTHVAGIVGGNGAMSSGKYEGVAPGADLIGYGSGAGISILDTLGGFDYALTHQAEYDIRVITNSWGSTSDSGTDFDPEDPINIATKKLYDRNIVTVFSAGNSGPGEATISGNYKKAPWVITVAAGDKQGNLTDFSSRGVKGKGGTVTVNGEEFTWEDRPTITTPGEDIISTKTIAPLTALSADKDAETLDPAHLPYYTHMSGTSMAAPHGAGIVALMLDADPSLTPKEVKEIIQQTATNMPGHEPWEVGAGYANAYAAVDMILNDKNYGQTLNLTNEYNANVEMDVERTPVEVEYNPVTADSNKVTFEVEEGLTELVARINAKGLLDETGNPLNLVLTSPDGTEYSSGIYVLFTLYTDRTVQVTNPVPGTWTLEIRGLQGSVGLPETVEGELAFKKASGFTGLNDISGHPAEGAIKSGVSERFLDSDKNGNYKPDDALTRVDLAKYLTMGAGIRQYLPNGGASFTDVASSDTAYVEAVAAKGAALKDTAQGDGGVLLPTADGKFSPKKAVDRAGLAYALVQSLGLESEAKALNDDPLTVQYKDERVAVEDAEQVPDHLKGYVQLALDLNILNAYFNVTQGPYDLEPTVTAVFEPAQTVTRGDYAVAISRYYANYLMP
ncbi:S8 family serine peptidase [Pseudalkalibacillus salsuginis]|uniref:S8 family serine peptidase n=1 Tax=Pseudalkalibacillus salsuginis TaxID=2910972 RepID=UPI001F2F5A60|nr:S8 family serine peptidase [Pseudalkalibacillus salsuginis]MCF6409447.1 S8 family serine peptidase [Pseudalkalibacillus salsuginis]